MADGSGVSARRNGRGQSKAALPLRRGHCRGGPHTVIRPEGTIPEGISQSPEARNLSRTSDRKSTIRHRQCRSKRPFALNFLGLPHAASRRTSEAWGQSSQNSSHIAQSSAAATWISRAVCGGVLQERQHDRDQASSGVLLGQHLPHPSCTWNRLRRGPEARYLVIPPEDPPVGGQVNRSEPDRPVARYPMSHHVLLAGRMLGEIIRERGQD